MKTKKKNYSGYKKSKSYKHKIKSQSERDGLFKMFGDIFKPGDNPLKVHEK